MIYKYQFTSSQKYSRYHPMHHITITITYYALYNDNSFPEVRVAKSASIATPMSWCHVINDWNPPFWVHWWRHEKHLGNACAIPNMLRVGSSMYFIELIQTLVCPTPYTKHHLFCAGTLICDIHLVLGLLFPGRFIGLHASHGNCPHTVHISEQKMDPSACVVATCMEVTFTLWLFNIAMENGPFIDGLDGLPIKNCDFPWLC